MGNCSAKSCAIGEDLAAASTGMAETEASSVVIKAQARDMDMSVMPMAAGNIKLPQEEASFTFRERILKCVADFERIEEEFQSLAAELQSIRGPESPALQSAQANPFSVRDRLMDCALFFERREDQIRSVQNDLRLAKEGVPLESTADRATGLQSGPVDHASAHDTGGLDPCEGDNGPLPRESETETSKTDRRTSGNSAVVSDGGFRPSATDASAMDRQASSGKFSSTRYVGTIASDSGSFPDPTRSTDKLSVVSALTGKELSPFEIRREMLARWLNAKVLENTIFKGIMVFCLVFALFGGGMWNLADIPDDPGNVYLDAIMFSVMVLFLAEVILNCIADQRHYPLSFFFWMDVLGTGSMIFEVSWMLGTAGQINTASASVDTVLMRTARAAKVGARVGRLTKITKCLSIIYKSKSKSMANDGRVEAKALSMHLMLSLSTKVSLLSIVLVLVVPLFGIGQYPETDLSMIGWTERLEAEYKRAYDVAIIENTTDLFLDSVERLKLFYADVNYFPYKISGYDDEVIVNGRTFRIPGQGSLDFENPARMQNVVRQIVDGCTVVRSACKGDNFASIYFDFSGPFRLEAGMDIVMIFFIITVMILASFDLSQTLDAMLVKPLEGMLGVLRSMAIDFLDQLQFEGGEDDPREEGMAELELLEIAFKKLVGLTTLLTQKNVFTHTDLAAMADAERGILVDMMEVEVRQRAPKSSMRGSSEAGLGGMQTTKSTVILATLPVSNEKVDSWELDVLDIRSDQLKQVAVYIFYDSEVGICTGHMFCNIEVFNRFFDFVKDGYKENPYHCYAHAIDVLHTVYRVLCLSKSVNWLSDVDHYALLVAALCHDLGHQGFTNPYLVETMHEMALRYNDKSPLENMHCAKLFEICSRSDCNVFAIADNEMRKRGRKVAIAAILHTDNVNHFDMVKEITKVYEINSLTCEVQASNPNDLEPDYEAEVLSKEPLLWCELFLHMADVSNPLKPFKVCKLWAWRVLDEFFAQGDEEKRLGIPVGLLNDRDKINRPGSQHGFINFLVAPLMMQAVKLFPLLHPLTTQMAQNLQQWRELWVEDAEPTVEDIAKKDVEVENMQNAARDLARRVGGRKTKRNPTVVCRSQGLAI